MRQYDLTQPVPVLESSEEFDLAHITKRPGMLRRPGGFGWIVSVLGGFSHVLALQN